MIKCLKVQQSGKWGVKCRDLKCDDKMFKSAVKWKIGSEVK
jgi:hypothetical protein